MTLYRTELIAILLLALTAALAVLAKRLQKPYPIVLVIGGLLLSFVPGLPPINLDPQLVFLVFLPPLLFSAAFNTSWREFRTHIISIVLLAFGLVGFTLVGVSLVTQYSLPGFDWKQGLVLGAVVATTDAIAATATAKRMGLPRRIVDLLEAESLVNDGSGLLALKFTTAIVVTGVTPTLLGGVSQLFYLIVAGVAIGLIYGAIFHFIQERISDAPVEITLSVVTPYITYLSAEAAHCSGVLATIACGVYLGRRSSHFYSLHARIESTAFWHTIDFMLNGLVFLLLGLQLPLILSDIRGVNAATLALDAVAFSLLVIALRMVWVFPGAWLSRHLRRLLLRLEEEPVSAKSVLLVGWAGMRGVLALAAALSLPERLANGQPFPHRSLIIFLTFAVICATLVLQGLSMPVLIRALNLTGGTVALRETSDARNKMTQAALHAISDYRRKNEFSREALDAMESFYRRQLAVIQGSANAAASQKEDAEAVHKLARELRSVERVVALRLRDENRIHDEVLRGLERELDLLEARFTPDE